MRAQPGDAEPDYARAMRLGEETEFDLSGRNIGDEYFGPAERFKLNDLDVLATGPIVREMSESFADSSTFTGKVEC